MLNQLIVNQLKTKLSEIEGVKKVFEWLSRPLGDKEYPAIIIRDPEDKVSDTSEGFTSNHVLLVEVDVVVLPDEYRAKELREFVPKIQKAVEETLSEDDFYYFAEYLGRSIIGEQKDYFYVASRLSFKIHYSTEKFRED